MPRTLQAWLMTALVVVIILAIVWRVPQIRSVVTGQRT